MKSIAILQRCNHRFYQIRVVIGLRRDVQDTLQENQSFFNSANEEDPKSHRVWKRFSILIIWYKSPRFPSEGRLFMISREASPTKLSPEGTAAPSPPPRPWALLWIEKRKSGSIQITCELDYNRVICMGFQNGQSFSQLFYYHLSLKFDTEWKVKNFEKHTASFSLESKQFNT